MTDRDGDGEWAGDPDRAEEWLTIGTFASRSRLSAKALRLYDRLGLLSPARVDPVSGYRFYRPAQVERARLVALLRQLDMPLATVKEIVALDDTRAAEAVQAYWTGVEERVAAQRTLVHFLRGRLSGRSSEMYEKFEIRTMEVPEQFVLCETRHTLAGDLPAFIGESLGRLEKAAQECGGIAATPFVAYHAEVTQESDGPVESCVPVADGAAARAWAGHQGRAVTARTEPARRLAYTRISKAQVVYPQIIAAYEAVERWIADQGLTIDGPCREVYFADWDTIGPDDEACDIAYPIG
ncbi:MerR family transcriptional regulator [Streptomyces sp. TRM66268-LWL]|uniref:MerR family transcriptional regulator n=1 Tax=Streptomyces polyasparticus TaxID=2767826 RepID=A0ABR7SWN1_9ACTN|nr:MerR family transcriptional regulator [Streptomyces polyasparticus]MBC9719007.1 MerR family transcriptional regulator [Streptomyces polyasparticus]